ncbi:Nuclear transcription factor Y subunit B-3 [Nymphaea thermarum]|nr:Nuclear transcription factor Y subunit B-3 [Nymphaea thermarum]
MSSPTSDNDCKAAGGAGESSHHDGCSKEQDRFLPIANVSRIMKKSLPANAKISKEAKETVQECVSEFISFITGEASDKCLKEKRKTINGDDLLWAMGSLGFEDYVIPLKAYLNKYRESEGEKNSFSAPRQGDQSPSAETSINNDSNSNNKNGSDHNNYYYHHDQDGSRSISLIDVSGLHHSLFPISMPMIQQNYRGGEGTGVDLRRASGGRCFPNP